MNILILGQYFTPEITAGAMRMHAFASTLATRGHRVEVISEVPSHPEGVVAEGYGGRLAERREMDGFIVTYVWVHATPDKGTRARMLNYASYAATATAVGSRRRQVDVILASSPPLTVGSAAVWLARRHRVPWVLDVRDLWPDVAVVVDQVEEGRMVAAARRLERRLYRRAAAVTATTAHFKRAIEDRGGAGKVTLIRNGAGAPALAAGAIAPDRALVADTGDFVLTYAGNLGLAQGLDAAVQAVGSLGAGFRMVLLGEGVHRDRLRALAERVGGGRIEFRDPVPPAEAARVMRASDALLVPLAAAPGLEGFVPSKLYDSAATGRPLIVSAAGEPAQLTADGDFGICVKPEDAAEIGAALRRLRDDTPLAERLGANARAFAEENSRERGAERMEWVLREVSGAR